jgi:GTP-binding protein LepA
MSSGFASIDYELIDYRDADIINLEVRINDTSIDVLSEFVYSSEVQYMARRKAEKLKEFLPRQQVKQVVQCIAEGRILAREEIPAFRKDVLAKMSGGDRTRKDKLLEKQKKGKKKMIGISKVHVPQEALLAMMKE